MKGKRPSFLPFGRPVFDEAEIEAVADAVRSGWVTTGPRVKEFQERFSDYTRCAHSLGLSSCTAALFLALKVHDIGEGDEVIVPPLTFAATANVIVHCGAKPVFADVDPHTGLVTPETCAKAVTRRTKAVIPVHLWGRPVDVHGFRALANEKRVAFIGDCAHATEARVDGRHVAAYADASAFSFYATKNLTTGEGGMLTGHDEARMSRASILALHGMSHDAFDRYSESGTYTYDIVEAGYKCNMSDIAAALGLAQLDRLESRLERRAGIWGRYDEAFADLPFVRPPDVPANIVHARHIYTLMTPPGIDREKVMSRIRARNIGLGIHFTALHLHSYYRNSLGTRRGDFPNAELISDSVFSLPTTPYLSDDDLEFVIDAVRDSVS